MQIIHDCAKNTFWLLNDEQQKIGEITYYKKDNNTLCASHTGVDPAYQGRGLAMRLVEALVAYATECDAKILPHCSYVADAFRKNPKKFAAVIEKK